MKNLYTFLLILLGTAAWAQERQVNHDEQLWMGYFNQTRFTDRWGMWADVHFRAKEGFVSEPSRFIGRLGLTYYIGDELKLTNGYAFINHYPEEGHENISMPEHRIWHQLQMHVKEGKVRMMQWLRLEERFRRNILNDTELADGYRFDTRLRYNFLVNVPLTKKGFSKGGLAWVINDEVMLNLSRNVRYNVFDQNRFFSGFAYYLGAHTNLQVGYMNVFQQKASGFRYDNTHCFRVFLFQNLDLRKGE